INQKVGPEHRVWDLPESEQHQSLWGLRAGVAAANQGNDKLNRFLPLLLRARHEDRVDLSDLDEHKRLADEAGLDVARFESDIRDPASLQAVAASHTEAVEKYGVFGTPTFVFPNGASAFLKMVRPRSPEDASRAFETVVALMESEVFIGEVKRPQPPWPKGIFD
ncbi:MAG: DsbA family protein, partial [Dehalococcoidia bacterium]